MIRWVIFCVAVVMIAGVATVASTFFVSSGPDELVPTAQDVPTGPPGDAEVDHPLVYEFGFMSQQEDGTHEWTVTNKGEGELKLAKGTSTCSCTIANLENGATATLAPGKTTKVTLNWNTKGNDGKYVQTATVLVMNDPKKQKLDFQVTGTVMPPILTMPRESLLRFPEVSNDKPHFHEMLMFSVDRPETKLTEAMASNPALLDVAIKPLTDKEVKSLRDEMPPESKIDIRKASKIIVTMKEGAPIGAFDEEVVVKTDHPRKPTYSFRVVGKVTGPITVSPDRFRFLIVGSKRGESQSLTLWVRDRKDTKFTIEKKPKNFKVEITPMESSGDGKAAKYQLTVTVPPDLPDGLVVEDIILKTDHPQAKEVKIPISVVLRAS